MFDKKLLIQIDFTTEQNARFAVERGDIMGYIEIPSNYTSHIIERALSGIYPEKTTLDGIIIKINLDMSGKKIKLN